MLTLYGYYRSSASYRVRIALNLKGLDAEHVPVNLAQGQQRETDYASKNPQQLVPALLTEGKVLLTQSLAIMEYLDEAFADTPRLLPQDPAERAQVRALAHSIASDMAPLNNLRVLKYLVKDMQQTEDAKLDWYRHWIATGFTAVEAMLQQRPAGRFCHGDTPGLADCCLVPQVYNAERFDCDLSAYPTICAIAEACAALPAFAAAHPAAQPDCPAP